MIVCEDSKNLLVLLFIEKKLGGISSNEDEAGVIRWLFISI